MSGTYEKVKEKARNEYHFAVASVAWEADQSANLLPPPFNLLLLPFAAFRVILPTKKCYRTIDNATVAVWNLRGRDAQNTAVVAAGETWNCALCHQKNAVLNTGGMETQVISIITAFKDLGNVNADVINDVMRSNILCFKCLRQQRSIPDWELDLSNASWFIFVVLVFPIFIVLCLLKLCLQKKTVDARISSCPE